MTGTFPTVTQAQEKTLRKAGWLPVLRWSFLNRNGTSRVVDTATALATVRAHDGLAALGGK
jgi:hypothetical protein